MHTGRLGNQVGTGLRRQRHRQAFFVTALRIGKLAVCGARDGGIGQTVIVRHLRAGGHRNRGFTTAAAHRAGAQVGQ